MNRDGDIRLKEARISFGLGFSGFTKDDILAELLLLDGFLGFGIGWKKSGFLFLDNFSKAFRLFCSILSKSLSVSPPLEDAMFTREYTCPIISRCGHAEVVKINYRQEMNTLLRFRRIAVAGNSIPLLRYCSSSSSSHLDPLYPRREPKLDKEWSELAKKQLKGGDPEEKLIWKTSEVIT